MEKRDVDKRQDSLAGASDTEGVGQRGLPMPARYAINALLTLGAILLGQLLISNAVITRYQTSINGQTTIPNGDDFTWILQIII